MVGLGSKDGHFSVAFCAALLGLDGRERRVWLGSKYWDLLEVKVLLGSVVLFTKFSSYFQFQLAYV